VAEIAAADKDPLVGPLRVGVIYTIAPGCCPSWCRWSRSGRRKCRSFIEENFTHKLIEKPEGPRSSTSLVLALPVEEPSLVAQGVYDEQFRVLAPAAHPWAKQKAIAASDLLDAQPLLMLGTGNCFRDQVLDLLHDRAISQTGESPHVLEGSSLETIRHMVASGVGVTVMPASSVDDISPKDPLLRVKPFQTRARRAGSAWSGAPAFPRHKAVDVCAAPCSTAKLPGTRVPPSR
jgi:LysR family hydrogen peroxide-inducible transcriptional activator